MAIKTGLLALLALLAVSAAVSATARQARLRGPGGRRVVDPWRAGEVTADSPNAAERLQLSQAHGAWAGVGASLPGGAGAALFPAAPGGTEGTEDSPEGPAVTPGLPDFFRGA